MAYVYIASTIPVWKLLQPRDFINSHQLVVGLAILYLGLLFTNPEITAPITNPGADTSWFPLLFITIACGAISGFHGLVSSGTSSKQLNKETDARLSDILVLSVKVHLLSYRFWLLSRSLEVPMNFWRPTAVFQRLTKLG